MYIDVLKVNSGLEELDLTDNQVNRPDIEELVQSLGTQIDIYNNPSEHCFSAPFMDPRKASVSRFCKFLR